MPVAWLGMCGIVGLAGKLAVADSERTASLLQRAANTLAHRGPNSAGVWVSSSSSTGFGHRRLAVIDLSELAHQPMVLEGPAEHALTFNGELYNHEELRSSLTASGNRFRSSGDTEVLLRSCRELGVEATLKAARGMFAFAYFDGASRTLWLARDRFGEKPLYYAVWDGSLAFASELKALRSIPTFPTDLDPAAVELLMRHSCIGGSRTIYRVARKVLPGAVLRIAVSDHMTLESITSITYWDPVEESQRARADPFEGNLAEAADALDELLGRSVVAASVGDVPIGAFLSGGIDSTSVVSQLVRRTTATVKTYTIGFSAESKSEAKAAHGIAEHLGTLHTELTVTARDAIAVIPGLPEIYDEPFADSSQIPTYLVSQLAQREVTVALSGDGGDELFCGYPRFRQASSVWTNLQRVPNRVRTGVATGLGGIPERSLHAFASAAGRGRLRAQSGRPSERVAKLSALLNAAGPDDVYRLFVSEFFDKSPMRNPVSLDFPKLPPAATPIERMMLRDTVTYLPDDILAKVDRAAMAVSLETRVPLLTPELFSFAQRLPLDFKCAGNEQKVVLRHLLARHVPSEFWDRPKQGFGIPLGLWLRGPLREWGADLLSTESFERHGLLDESLVRQLWIEHQEGKRNWGSRLWNVLMFQAWAERWL